MKKKITGILIDTESNTAKPITIDDTLEAYYSALNCSCIDIVSRTIGENEKYFTIVCGAVPGGRSTKEEVIEHLLFQLDTNEDLVMVGDTIYDVKGAAYHGIPCIAVSWGYGVMADMIATGATAVTSAKELYLALQ